MLERDFRYKPPIPEDLQRRYEAELHGVLRWKNGNWADNIYETDMDHVVRMFFVLSDIKKSCPTLSSDVDIPIVEHMIYVHDAGEILTGDLTHNRNDYDTLYARWKNRERASFRLLTKQIEDEGIKLQARKLFNRCFAQREDDKEALLTEFIDKVQGSRFGFSNVFHGRRMKNASREMQFNHTVTLLVKPLKPLLRLISPNTQTDLAIFFRTELEKFAQYGYGREATPYIKNLDAIFQ